MKIVAECPITWSFLAPLTKKADKPEPKQMLEELTEISGDSQATVKNPISETAIGLSRKTEAPLQCCRGKQGRGTR